MNACCTPVSVRSQLNVSTHQGYMSASVLLALSTTSVQRLAMVRLCVIVVLTNKVLTNVYL